MTITARDENVLISSRLDSALVPLSALLSTMADTGPAGDAVTFGAPQEEEETNARSDVDGAQAGS